ncbi:PBSX family phage terminase large subunit [Eubacteriales bacterium OttesenSCG-928-A19]|nr:PBSX family phage terminase large subunit [Eubacteriales bacterium OttesenSCG-928-A19]
MRYQNLSKRQLLAMTWWKRPRFKHLDGIVCDGSIRSGKTVSMSVGFILWAMASFDGAVFAICGKTIESLRRNVITKLPTWLEGIVSTKERRNENMLIVSVNGRTNSFYLFGGRDESSYALIQGITLAGVLFDEVALMPRSFVEQALARCSVDGSTFWFNCNPEGPDHWFYKEWVLKHVEKNVLHLHFTMEDNNSLSEKTKRRYEVMYSGVFYDRYVRGLWVVAEGLIYPMFDRHVHIFTDANAPLSGEWFISIDYGIQNPFSAGLWCVSGGVAYRMAEYYHDGRADGQRTDEEHADAVLALAGKRYIKRFVIDPSAASFIACLRRRGLAQRLTPANNEVVAGISNVASALRQNRLMIHESCTGLIRELGLYSWDGKAKGDKPLKENDHAADETRYFVRTILRKKTPTIDQLSADQLKGVRL